MYQPEFTVRIEVAQTDAENLREWRVILGGAVRGGLSMNHGYIPTAGPLLLEGVDDLCDAIRASLESYATGLGGWQLEMPLE